MNLLPGLTSVLLLWALIQSSNQDPVVLNIKLAVDRPFLSGGVVLPFSEDRGIRLGKMVAFVKEHMSVVNKLLSPLDVYIQITGVALWEEEPISEIDDLRAYFLSSHDRLPDDETFHIFLVWTGKPRGPDDPFSYGNNGSFCSQSPLPIALIPLVTPKGTKIPDERFRQLIIYEILRSIEMPKCLCVEKGEDDTVKTSLRCVVNLRSYSTNIPPCTRAILHNDRVTKCHKRVTPVNFGICGNGVVENSEKCDCFAFDEECQRCCHACSNVTCIPVIKPQPSVTPSDASIPPIVTKRDHITLYVVSGVIGALILVVVISLIALNSNGWMKQHHNHGGKASPPTAALRPMRRRSSLVTSDAAHVPKLDISSKRDEKASGKKKQKSLTSAGNEVGASTAFFA